MTTIAEKAAVAPLRCHVIQFSGISRFPKIYFQWFRIMLFTYVSIRNLKINQPVIVDREFRRAVNKIDRIYRIIIDKSVQMLAAAFPYRVPV